MGYGFAPGCHGGSPVAFGLHFLGDVHTFTQPRRSPMKWSPMLLTARSLLTTPAWATTGRTVLGFRTGMDGPRTTRVLLRQDPVLVRVPDTRVYVVRNYDYDMFRYGSTFYVMRDGWWYRSSSPRGVYRIVD